MIDQGLLQMTRRVLEDAGIRPTRHLGQNYVVDRELISCMLDAAQLSRRETVLEIGAGIGILTRSLSELAARVVAVEKDPASARFLEREFSCSNVEVVMGDVLEMDLPEADKIVSNLPYSISTPVTFKILFEGRFERAILTYQREVAERLGAPPGGPNYSRLSVATTLLTDARIIGEFSQDSFYPRPGVGSAVVILRRREGGKGLDWAWLDDTLKALFSQRRRRLSKALETYSKNKGLDCHAAIEGIERGLLGSRVYTIAPEDFVRINEVLKRIPGNRLSVIS